MLLQEGEVGRKEINRHLMEVYTEPLVVYLGGHSGRRPGDPRETVHGFFANRLARDDFVAKWQQSGLRLRRWLMNALSFYVMECRPRGTTMPRPAALSNNLATDAGRPEEAVDRAFARSIVKQALRRAQHICRLQRLEEHWRIFVRHYYEGQRYEHLAADFDVTPARAAVMARTAGRKFRSALCDLVLRDGAAPGELERDIRTLLEVTAV